MKVNIPNRDKVLKSALTGASLTSALTGVNRFFIQELGLNAATDAMKIRFIAGLIFVSIGLTAYENGPKPLASAFKKIGLRENEKRDKVVTALGVSTFFAFLNSIEQSGTNGQWQESAAIGLATLVGLGLHEYDAQEKIALYISKVKTKIIDKLNTGK